MNVFDLLANGKSRIREETISSVLAWMLDPSQSHGWGTAFLERFLLAVDKDLFPPFIQTMSRHVSSREMIRVQATVITEESVTTATGKRRDIDIVLYLDTGTNYDTPRFVLVKNGIGETPVAGNSLTEEIEGFLNGEYRPRPQAVAMVYLSLKKAEASVKEFRSIESRPGPTAHLSWKGSEVGSIEWLVASMLEDDERGAIDPLCAETQWILKSLLHSIRTEFRVRSQRQRNVAGARSEYFIGWAQGIEELRALAEDDGALHVGFNGGTTALDVASREYLENRVFKYDNDPARGNKIPKNWLNIKDVLNAYDR